LENEDKESVFNGDGKKLMLLVIFDSIIRLEKTMNQVQLLGMILLLLTAFKVLEELKIQ